MDDATLTQALIDNDYKPATVRKYVRWYRSAPSYDEADLDEWLKDNKTRTSILSAVRKCLEVQGIDNAYLMPLATKYKAEKPLFAVQKKESPDRDYPWTRVLELLEESRTTVEASEQLTVKDFKFWIILELLQRGFVFRIQDYSTTAIVTNCEEHEEILPPNYLCLSTGKWIISEYKNDKTKGPREYTLDSDFIEKVLLNRRKASVDAPWLIPADDGTSQTTPDAFSKWMRRSDLKASSQTLRTLYVSYKNDQGMSGVERESLADTMDHSVLTQHTVYSKKSKNMLYEGGAVTDENIRGTSVVTSEDSEILTSTDEEDDEFLATLTLSLQRFGKKKITALLKAML